MTKHQERVKDIKEKYKDDKVMIDATLDRLHDFDDKPDTFFLRLEIMAYTRCEKWKLRETLKMIKLMKDAYHFQRCYHNLYS